MGKEGETETEGEKNGLMEEREGRKGENRRTERRKMCRSVLDVLALECVYVYM